MTTLLTLALLALSSEAQAQACNPKALTKELGAAVPQEVPAAWGRLRDCDSKLALAQAKGALDRSIPGPATDALVLEVLAVGGDDAARAWLGALPADERSRTLALLGQSCDKPRVPEFLAAAPAALGDRFWTERWYRSMAACRAPAVQTLLEEELRRGNPDRTRFFGIVEVYARNLGKDAIPTLQELGGTLTDTEELIYLLNAFSDAAQVGSNSGTDPEAAAAAVAAIVALSPKLPPRAVESARTTLLSLGAEAEANRLAALRFADRAWPDGQLHHGLVVVETAACKKGKTWVGVHVGEGVHGGVWWPDQMQAQADAAAGGWTYELAGKCKGTSTNTVLVSPEPLAPDALKSWQDEQVREASKAVADKLLVLPEEALRL